MKISYIITPFENSEYLIRCVNSLYREIGSGYEVILAENDFGEDSDELNSFLDEKRQLVRISQNVGSEAEKLAEAVRLISDDSDYVMLVDVDTVVAPIAAQAILSCEKSDLIIPAAAMRNGAAFLLDAPDEIALIQKIGRYAPDRFCFGRKLFAEFFAESLRGQKQAVCHWVLSKLSENPVIGFTKDVCMYMENSMEQKEEKLDAGQWKAVMAGITDRFENMENIKIKLGVVDKFIGDFLEIMEQEPESAAPLFMEFQNLCGKCKGVPLLDRLMEQRAGFRSEELICLSLEEYRLFRNLSRREDSPLFAAGHPATQDKLLSEMKISVEELKREVNAVKAGAGMTMAPSFGQMITDPMRDIPRMYQEGRLGLKTILRSFMGWLSYKLHGGR